MLLSITIPGPVVAKGRPRVTSAGKFPRVFTPAKTRHYEDLIRCEAATAMNGNKPLEEPCCMSITAYVQPPKSMSKKKRLAALNDELRPSTRPDVDNYAKAALDGCNAIIFRDDSLVTDLIVRKRYSERPRLVITVETEAEYG